LLFYLKAAKKKKQDALKKQLAELEGGETEEAGEGDAADILGMGDGEGDETSAGNITQLDVNTAFQRVITIVGVDQAKSILNQLEAVDTTKIPESKWAKAIKLCEAAGA